MAGVQITGLIKPLNAGSFPVWEDINGLGGFRSAADATARDAIPANFRKIGMTVVLQSTGVAYKLTGGITNGDWQVFGGSAALSIPPFQSTFYCTPGATPSANVFATLQSAFSAVTPGTPTLILAAPITWNENVTVPTGLTVALAVEEFGGFRGTINGSVTWQVATPDFLSIEGFDLPGGIAQQQVGTTNGPATLRLGNLFCDGITGALTHAVVSLLVFGQLDDDTHLGGTNLINGSVLLENVTATGPITTPSMGAINSQLANSITCPDLAFVACEFFGITVNCSGNIRLDSYSAYQFKGVTLAGGGTVHLATGDTLEQFSAGTGGATPTIDFRAHSSLRFDLDQDCVPVFGAPLYSQVLALHLLQSGAENWLWTWPANVVNPPPAPLTGQIQYLLLYQKEINAYFVFPPAPDLSSFIVKVGGVVEVGLLVADTGNLVANPNLSGYQVSASLGVSTTSIAGAIALDVSWTDPTSIARTKRIVQPVLTTGQNFDCGVLFIRSKAGVPITYAIVVTTPLTGSPQGSVEFEVLNIA